MRGFTLFTGGKDSTLATILAIEDGLNIDALLTMVSQNPYSYMFHTINVRWTWLQAVSMGKTHYVFKTLGVKERELRDLERAFIQMHRMGYDTVVTGAIASRYQRDRILRVASRTGLNVYSPLWGLDQEELLFRYIDKGLKFMITSVSALGLGEGHLGWVIKDSGDVERLIRLSRRHGFNPCGEGGEYESYVLDSSIFRWRVEVLSYRKVWLGDSGYIEIRDARLKLY